VGEVAEMLRELLQTKVTELGGEILAIEVMPDHVHLFVEMPPSFAPAQIVFRLKGFTSHELRSAFPWLKSRLPSLWSRSYYVGTARHVSEETNKQYIAAQKRSPRGKVP
jgi:putative transposase